jgi:fumarate hydratase class II
MPGKINPTQIEALTMICLRVIGNDTSITMANSQGQFQLNTYKPLIIHLLLESIELLADSCNSFTIHCLAGIEVNKKQIESHSSNSLMLATALVPTLGYDQTAKLVEYAHERGLSLKDAAVERGDMSREEFEKQVNPLTMLAPTAKSD